MFDLHKLQCLKWFHQFHVEMLHKQSFSLQISGLHMCLWYIFHVHVVKKNYFGCIVLNGWCETMCNKCRIFLEKAWTLCIPHLFDSHKTSHGQLNQSYAGLLDPGVRVEVKLLMTPCSENIRRQAHTSCKYHTMGAHTDFPIMSGLFSSTESFSSLSQLAFGLGNTVDPHLPICLSVASFHWRKEIGKGK